MTKFFFIIAGEASGDALGEQLIKEIKLKFQNESLEFAGVGGKLMQSEGLKSIFPIEDLSVMGFFEVLPHIPKLLKRIDFCVKEITARKPDFIITIDSPDFNFRVMEKIKNTYFFHVKKIHIVAPSVWAYREGRAKKIAKLYDLLFAILPFEPPLFEACGLKTVFIGHPLIKSPPNFKLKYDINSNFRYNLKITKDDFILYLTPGSRISEIKKIFPEFIKTINILGIKNLVIVIPVLEKTRSVIEKMAKKISVRYILLEQSEKNSALMSANFALAKSGTNTLEISLYRVPMVVCYKVGFFTYLLAKMLLKVKFANLINIVLNREIIPELLQGKCRAEIIAAKIRNIISDEGLIDFQIGYSDEALKLLGLGQDKFHTSVDKFF
jgi:lipid-A-disaccharide synthase